MQKKYASDNIIVEDFIPFSEVMPNADVYITNGGYGDVMLSIENRLPMVVAGVHEGKSEINARVEYFKLGINLRTGKPTPSRIRKRVEKVLNDVTYQNNIDKLSSEFSSYNSGELCTFYINQVLNKENRVKVF